MFVAADFVLGIVCALLTDFEILSVCWLWKILQNLIIISKVGGKLRQREGYMEQYLSDQNHLHIFDNDNFLIIPKSIYIYIRYLMWYVIFDTIYSSIL